MLVLTEGYITVSIVLYQFRTAPNSSSGRITFRFRDPSGNSSLVKISLMLFADCYHLPFASSEEAKTISPDPPLAYPLGPVYFRRQRCTLIPESHDAVWNDAS
jgi:hypothetical protein